MSWRTSAPPADADLGALRTLGLARRAGEAMLGTRAVKEAGRAGELGGVVIARDAAKSARRRVGPLLEAGGVPIVEFGTRATLGRAVGRSRIAMVGIRHGALARMVLDAAD